MFVSKIKYDLFSRFIFKFQQNVFKRVSYYFILESYDALRIITTISFEIFLNLLMQFLISTSRCNS